MKKRIKIPVSKTFKQAMLERTKSLDVTTSEYLSYLARNDLLTHASKPFDSKPEMRFYGGPMDDEKPSKRGKCVSIWLKQEFHKRIKARAADLDMNVTEYLSRLAKNDMTTGGILGVIPKSSVSKPDSK